MRRSDISAFVAILTDKKLAPATLTTVYRILAMILRSAVYDRILAESPCYKIKIPRIPPKTLQAFTPVEVWRLLDTAIDLRCWRVNCRSSSRPATPPASGWRSQLSSRPSPAGGYCRCPSSP